MKNSHLAKWALSMFRKSILIANSDIDCFLKSRSGKTMVSGWPVPDARFFADPAWLKLMYDAMAEGFRQKKDSLETIYQEHRLFMKPWSEPITKIPADKLTLWQGVQDKTCPKSNAEAIAQICKSARLEVFREEGHCVIFAKPEKLAKHFYP
jgi:pimeloyl-ACP methyl ester carboxylesterase